MIAKRIRKVDGFVLISILKKKRTIEEIVEESKNVNREDINIKSEMKSRLKNLIYKEKHLFSHLKNNSFFEEITNKIKAINVIKNSIRSENEKIYIELVHQISNDIDYNRNCDRIILANSRND
jgi:hypothetical protein